MNTDYLTITRKRGDRVESETMPIEGQMHPSFRFSQALDEDAKQACKAASDESLAALRSKPYMREGQPPVEEPEGDIPRIVDSISIGFIPGEGWFQFCPCGRKTSCAPAGGPPELTFEQVMGSAKRHDLEIVIRSRTEEPEEEERVRGAL
jgi:hypothetical protein